MNRFFFLSIVVFSFLFSMAIWAASVRHDKSTADFSIDAQEHPHIVFSLMGRGDCAATLIGPRHLITVAHCVEEGLPRSKVSLAGRKFKVRKVFIHSDWDDEFDFDIAIIELKKSVPVQVARPVPIYWGNLSKGTLVTLFGNGSFSNGLKGQAKSIDDAQPRSVTNRINATSRHFLEITMTSPKSVSVTEKEGVGLSGDSGGPVFVSISDKPHLVGLNSWGVCGEDPDEDEDDGKLGLYGCRDYQTRVARYRLWIQKILK